MISKDAKKLDSHVDSDEPSNPMVDIHIGISSFKSSKGDLAKQIRETAEHHKDVFLGNVYDSLANHIESLEESKESIDTEKLSKFSNATSCRYVYWGCGGICGEDGARVDGYCDSSGGSDPDYWYCESC